MSDDFIRTADADHRAKPRNTTDTAASHAPGSTSSPAAQRIIAARPAQVTDGHTGELSLEERGVRELRRRARQLHIHNHSKMNKHELIAAIRHSLG